MGRTDGKSEKHHRRQEHSIHGKSNSSNAESRKRRRDDDEGSRGSIRKDRKKERSRKDFVKDGENDDRLARNDKEDRHHNKSRKERKHHHHRQDSDNDPSSRRHHHRHEKHSRKSSNDKYQSKKDSKKKSTHAIKEEKHKIDKLHALSVDKTKLYPLGEPLGHPPPDDQLLDPERDYFAYHKHLWLFLYRERATAFDDLSSDEARGAFVDFCQLYNAGKLEAAYYKNGLPVDALEECKTTRHSWDFKISDREDKSLQVLLEGVHKQTEYQSVDAAIILNSKSGVSSVKPSLPDNENNRKHHRSPEKMKQERLQDRRLREHVATVHEEITGGRKEGHERKVEKRRELTDKIHGAARERDSVVEVNDETLYGGSDFSQVERYKHQAARREEQNKARLMDLQEKEKQKQVAMLELLGLSDKIKSGKKIIIEARKD